MGKKQDRSVSLNPKTPYDVYECSVDGRVFYIGIAWNDSRSDGKWDFYASVVRTHDGPSGPTADTTKKLRSLTGQVFSWMIRNGVPKCDARVFRKCVGRKEAAEIEKMHIRTMSLTNVLANTHHNLRRPKPTRDDVLRYVGYRT